MSGRTAHHGLAGVQTRVKRLERTDVKELRPYYRIFPAGSSRYRCPRCRRSSRWGAYRTHSCTVCPFKTFGQHIISDFSEPSGIAVITGALHELLEELSAGHALAVYVAFLCSPVLFRKDVHVMGRVDALENLLHAGRLSGRVATMRARSPSSVLPRMYASRLIS